MCAECETVAQRGARDYELNEKESEESAGYNAGMSEERKPDCVSRPSMFLLVVLGVLSLASVAASYVYVFLLIRWLIST